LSKWRIYLQDYSEQGEDDEGEPDANDNWVYRVLVMMVSLVSLLCLATLAIDVVRRYGGGWYLERLCMGGDWASTEPT
jgi:hypothetical protein